MHIPAYLRLAGFTPVAEIVPDIEGDGVENYECFHCEGETLIVLLKNENKGTLPTIQFCPLCGMSNEYPVEEV
jgi:hypothetical protein